jgi:hypothetical protein
LRLQVLRAAAITATITDAFTVGCVGHLHRASPLHQFIARSKVRQAAFYFPFYTTSHTHSQNVMLHALCSFIV